MNATKESKVNGGEAMFALARELFPICRSITGDGLRATLERIRQEIPIRLHEVPSGTPVLDWTIPDEWKIRDAWIKDSRGHRVVNFRVSNLHVVNYSVPVQRRISMAELQPHLHTLPDRPDWIPYRTTYYRRDWGFCLAHRQLADLKEPEYEVCIESAIQPGSLTYAELLLPGETKDEFLFSAHCCHPSLANDNLSGIVVATALAQSLMRRSRRRLSYRFLFAPGTIGAIAWLATNENAVHAVRHGLVLTCVGDAGSFTYKRSRQGNAEIDRAVESILTRLGAQHRVVDFSPYGYDERQFCSPGFNLPVGCFMRSQHGTFPEYHTSADNLSFIHPARLEETALTLLKVVDLIESEHVNSIPAPASRAECEGRRFQNLRPHGEPQLGKYGFYEAFSGNTMAGLWVLNLSDGHHSLTEIARRSALPFDTVEKAADVLATLGLVREVSA